MDKPRVFAASDAWSLTVCRNVVVSLWRAEVDLDGIRETDRAIRKILAKPEFEAYGSVTVIEPTMSLRMSEEAREQSTALQKRWMDRMLCSAYVVEGNSFVMAAVRTMTAGMSLLTRSPYPIRSFADPMSAAEWVGASLDMPSNDVLKTISIARGTGYTPTASPRF